MDKQSKGQPAASASLFSTERGRSEPVAIKVPKIELPTGGGAVRGIDEVFKVNPVNGTAGLSLPLPVAAARGAVPALTLAYSSGGGNGIFGLGWELGLPTIKRKTRQELPRYLDGRGDAPDSDTFILAGAEDLVPAFAKTADGAFIRNPDRSYRIQEYDAPDAAFTVRRYRPRVEGGFARIERWTHKASGATRWRVTSPDNVTTLLGWSEQARIADPADARRVYEWLPEFVYDDRGNCSHYSYKPEDDAGFDPALPHNANRRRLGRLAYTNRYLARIRYGNRTPYRALGDPFPAPADYLFETAFDYGDHAADPPYEAGAIWSARPDAFSDYKPGFDLRCTRLCRRVMQWHYFPALPQGKALVRSLDLAYDTPPGQPFATLASATMTGYARRPDGSYTRKSLPPVVFSWQAPAWNTIPATLAPDSAADAPVGIAPPYLFTDLYGEGLAGILSEQADGWYYKRNLGAGRFTHARQVSPRPNFSGLGRQLSLTDLDADGTRQLVDLAEVPRGYFELDPAPEQARFASFAQLPSQDLADPQARFIDLDGDGRPDLLVTEDAVFTWYPSQGRQGFGPGRRTPKPFDEEAGPALVFANELQSIFLADMSGDGLVDLVRVRQREVCYWPNLGQGRFGAKVAMGRPPACDGPDGFSASRVRLADLDGAGPSDLVYVGRAAISCWRNLNGNEFAAAPLRIDAPWASGHGDVAVADLLGSGTACIVWSSPLAMDAGAPLRYVDLMEGRKPYLLSGYRNQLGKEVRLDYTPSTRFYIEDERAGQPWASKLHFPVHCLSRVETLDHVSGQRLVNHYRYRHGYYDHAEREFRGFGLCERQDSERFEHWGLSGAGKVVDQALHEAPVLSRSWYHTGSMLDQDRLFGLFAAGFWYEERARAGFPVVQNERALPDLRLRAAPGIDPALVAGLSAEEWRQAMRSCKGMPLRAELFALDAPASGATPEQLARQLTPCAVTAANCAVDLLQPMGQNRYAVFAAKESESLSYQYERDPSDPRIGHTLNVRFDDYGNLLESASVAYGRLAPDPGLAPAVQAAQAQTFIHHKQAEFTDDRLDGDNWRLRVPSEERHHELRGVAKSGAYYTPADFDGILALATPIPFDQFDRAPPPGTPERRLVEHLRIRYYDDALAGPLPAHRQGALGLAHARYQLAYTRALLATLFGARASDAVMLEGRYQHTDGDADWWVGSGTPQYKLAAETALDAARRFYMPLSYTDPLGAVTAVGYLDDTWLFVGSTEDAAGNLSTIERFDYRTLAPRRIRDPNDNLSDAVADELGMVKATALLGKGSEGDDLGALDEFSTPAEDAAVAALFGAADSAELVARAKALLAAATRRFVYDLAAFQTRGTPVAAASILRERHASEVADAGVILSFAYSDGAGHVALKKGQAEPGLAIQVVPGPGDSIAIGEVDTTPQLRWVGNGRSVVNNKGDTVEQYEPYFSVTHAYEAQRALAAAGVTSLFYHDPLGRLLRTVLPDGSFSKTTFGAWQQRLYDQGDTVLDSRWYLERANSLIDGELLAEGKDPASEKAAALASASYHDTPAVLDFDTLGRAVQQTQHNRVDASDSLYLTQLTLDIEGCLRALVDARGNTSLRYGYDLRGALVFQDSADAGRRWMLDNVAGQPLRSWDERGHTFAHAYDALGRKLGSRVLGGDGPLPLDHLYERCFYGEGAPNDKADNLRGQLVRHYDTGGLLEVTRFSFKGQPLDNRRRLFAAYKDVPDWSDAQLEAALEPAVFVTGVDYDALGRVVRTTLPDASVEQVSYNAAGLLDSKTVTDGALTDTIIDAVAYNAKGQRLRMVLGNGVVTTWRYDRQTFSPIAVTSRAGGGAPLQDQHLTYDAVGNVSRIEDRALPLQFFNNQVSSGSLDYRYDAIYRLVEASGRENNAALAFGAQDNWNDAACLHLLQPGDPAAMRNYTQSYAYDALGNITRMRHQASGNDWVRDYAYAADSNRLLASAQGAQTWPYPQHPRHGFITALPQLPDIGWNFLEKPVRTAQQQVVAGTPETTYYQYGADGTRLRKITENAAPAGQAPARKEERVYVGAYERYTRFGGANAGLVRHSLSVADANGRAALIETRNAVDDGSDRRRVRYQLASHLGSVNLEVDDRGRVVSYEEYHPFGTTAYQTRNAQVKVAAKRYRYTGRERDDETGLAYHGARYYLPWLGRWLNPDPIGIGDGLNLYRYARDNPVSYSDTSGNESDEQKASRMLEEFLIEQGVNYRKEVPFKVEVNGKWVEGRADFFVQTAGGWKPVEMKGKASSPWTEAQHEYLPALQAGARFETIGTGKFASTVTGSGGGKVLNVHTVAAGKYDFQKEFSATYIRRPGGDPAKGEKITTTKDIEGNKLRETREPFTGVGTRAASPEPKVEFREPHVTVHEPRVHIKEPHVKIRGKGLIIGGLVALGTLLFTGDSYAAVQSVNPAAETTDAIVEHEGVKGVAWGVVKDLWYLTPPGMVHAGWQLNDQMMAASHFPAPAGFIDRMRADGRNPFCALCHDPRGPGSPEYRQAQLLTPVTPAPDPGLRYADPACILPFLTPQQHR